MLSNAFLDSDTLFLGRVVLFVTITAAVNLVFLVCEVENLVQTLLDGRNASRILAVDDVDKLLRKLQLLLFDDTAVSDDVDGDRVVDEAKCIKVQLLKRRLHCPLLFLPEYDRAQPLPAAVQRLTYLHPQ